MVCSFEVIQRNDAWKGRAAGPWKFESRAYKNILGSSHYDGVGRSWTQLSSNGCTGSTATY